MKRIARRSWPEVTTDGTGVVSHAGTVLLRELAERTGLCAGLSEAADGLRSRRSGHDPGQVLTDLAVMLADGGEAISDIAALNDQQSLHGPVASTATAWRVLAGLDERMLSEVSTARAAARQRAWLARAELTGRMLPAARAGGRVLDYAVLDLDATLVEVHSDQKEQAAAHFKGGFGFHPLLCFLHIQMTTRTKPWRGCCARATPVRIPPPITSLFWTQRWPSYRRRRGPGGSWSAPMAPGSPTPSSTTSLLKAWNTHSAMPSPRTSAQRYQCCPNGSGASLTTATAAAAKEHRSPN